MSAAQKAVTQSRPWHLWLIGVVGFLWNSIGAVSFVLTQLNVEAVMSEYPAEQRAYFVGFPLWANAFWAIGVFGGVIGCLLMLLQRRLAVPVLFASVIGAIVSNFGGLFFLGGMEVMRATDSLGFSLFFAVFISVFAAFLAYYARTLSRRGVLA
jgi:hypothetical protein